MQFCGTVILCTKVSTRYYIPAYFHFLAFKTRTKALRASDMPLIVEEK